MQPATARRVLPAQPSDEARPGARDVGRLPCSERPAIARRTSHGDSRRRAGGPAGVGSTRPDVVGGDPDVVWLRQLLGRSVLGPEGHHLGHVHDVAVQRTRDLTAHVSGLVIDVGGEQFFAAATAIRPRGESLVAMAVVPRRSRRSMAGELLLAADLLGRPVLGATVDQRLRIVDVGLRRARTGWVVDCVDTRGAVRRLLGLGRQLISWDHLTGRRAVTSCPRPDRSERTSDVGM